VVVVDQRISRDLVPAEVSRLGRAVTLTDEQLAFAWAALIYTLRGVSAMWKLVVLLKTLFMAACAITIFGVVTRQLLRLDPFLPAALPSWITVGGLALMVVGAILSFACFGLFSMSGALSRHAHFPDPEVFITWGPYRYVRNPMTKGGWTVLCGWGLYQLSPAILLFAGLMAVAMHLFVVFVEEPKLERRFGESYREYKRRVNRWVPRLAGACRVAEPRRSGRA
jgi:protein-S-isoprenylcysteine O-methyltransferase Ste14